MKFVLKIQGNMQNAMRQAGYYFDREDGKELVFVKSLGASRSGYPRFHVYLKVSRETNEAIINLHLDQKKPSYKGASSHNAEYDGQLVEREAERIKKTLSGL